MLENSPLIPPNCRWVANPKAERNQLVAARTINPAAAAYAPRELDGRTSAAKAFDRLVADIESDRSELKNGTGDEKKSRRSRRLKVRNREVSKSRRWLDAPIND